jgi:hypothetical protein
MHDADFDSMIKIDLRLENETARLTRDLTAELFQTTKQNIGLHVQTIFE